MAPALSAEPGPGPRSGTHWIVWIFAVVGVLGALSFIILAAMIFGAGSRQPPAAVVAETSASRFVVRDAEPIRGTNLVRISIAAGAERSPYSSGGMDDERNILLLDRTSGAVRRLLPDNGRRIARSYFLPARAEASADPSGEIAEDRDGTGSNSPAPLPPAYFALLVAQPDQGERFDLVIGALADEQHGFTMPGLAGVDGVWMQNPTQIALIVREGLNLFYRIVDVPSRRIVLSRRIAI
jgi:hypothetical protein